MSVTLPQNSQVQIYYGEDAWNLSGLAQPRLNSKSTHLPDSFEQLPFRNQAQYEYGSSEMIFIITLILALPITIYLAYRYGKKKGRKEHQSPAHQYFGQNSLKRNSPDGSTSDTSHRGYNENEKCSSTDSSPALSNPKSSRQGSSQLGSADKSFLLREPLTDLVLNDEEKVNNYQQDNFRFTVNYEKTPLGSSNLECDYNEQAIDTQERIKLHTTDEEVDKHKLRFDISFSKKEGKLYKTETTEVTTVYKEGSSEPEERAKNLAKNTPIFNSLMQRPAQQRTTSQQPEVETRSLVPMKKTLSDPSNNYSLVPIQAQRREVGESARLQNNLILARIADGGNGSSGGDDEVELGQTLAIGRKNGVVNGNSGATARTKTDPIHHVIHEDSDEHNSVDTQPKKNQTFPSRNISIDSTQSKTISALAQQKQSFQHLIEEFDLPDETGKFNKIFKQPQRIGQGSFGEVFQVTHRVDGKKYAVKKVKLKFGRFDDLQKESKVFREVFAMTDLHHPNIVRYSTCWVEIEFCNEETKKPNRRCNSLQKIKEEPENDKNQVFNEISIDESDSFVEFKRSISQAQENGKWPKQKKEVSSESESSLTRDYNKKFDSIEDSDVGLVWDRSNGGSKQDVSHMESSKSKARTLNKKNSKKINQFNSISESVDEDSADMNSSRQSLSMLSNYTSKDPIISSGLKLFLYIQMEFCPGLSLRSYLDSQTKEMQRIKILKMFRNILEGVQAIHSRGILHRDLKPANIFLDDNGNIKIGDFGLASLENVEDNFSPVEKLPRGMDLFSARSSRKNHSMKVGTPLYTSPEQESGGSYDYKTDIYSLGLIFCEFLTCFSTHHERYLFLNGLRLSHTLPEHFVKKYPDESKLILSMTQRLPLERPSAEELIKQIDKLLAEETSVRKDTESAPN